ncbi:MAG: histidine phosphatase family protein [Lachnospiraceae bacterium]|nr:histidine phosphatase family protein [Lachnospiraceae bacterium]SDW56959.1 alpha-ribazole phosphatase/probable phosphoglycerate mutase [Lachnospiraceae bacterium KHCPX20]
MKIWIIRHGQTKLNAQHLMQGCYDEPLNEVGIQQAKETRKRIGDIHFDAVYSSPLQRAKATACIVGDITEDKLIVDERIKEVNFGDYELCPYDKMGLKMSLYWALPEIFPAPRTVETVKEMVARTSDFLKELEQKDYENVLVACHGGIMRPLSGYLTNKRNGLLWRPRPTNCEIRVFESIHGQHRMIENIIMNPEKSKI